MKLYHTGTAEIKRPDLSRGRRNADFGQGFYLSPDLDFSRRWASADAVLNEYELDEGGLTIIRFERGEEWFRFIFGNRRGIDGSDADVIIGPIANDTIFDSFGILTSGLLREEDAMKLLMAGPEYIQVALKTEKAAEKLRWIRSEKIGKLDAAVRKAEQERYDAEFSAILNDILNRE